LKSIVNVWSRRIPDIGWWCWSPQMLNEIRDNGCEVPQAFCKIVHAAVNTVDGSGKVGNTRFLPILIQV
jgi:hypothetical protein